MVRKNKILSVDNMILNTENLKYSKKILLELINEFSEVTGYKSNVQKSVFLCTNNEAAESEIKKKFHLQLHQRQLYI